MEQSENNNFSDILSAFNVINTSLAFDAYLPIAKKSVRFKQLTTGQEKRIAKQLLIGDDKTIYSVLPEILQENCLDPSFIVKKASIIDFFCIIIQTRIYSIGNTITIRTYKKTTVDSNMEEAAKTISDKIPEGGIIDKKDDKPKKKPKGSETIDIKIDLIKICEAIEKETKDYHDITISDDNLPYRIECGVPTVETISRSIETKEEENDIISKILKFISKIYLINQTTKEAKEIPFSSFTPDQAKELLEQLPNRLLVQATEKIFNIFKLLSNIQLYKFTIQGAEYYQTINFTSLDFFTSF